MKIKTLKTIVLTAAAAAVMTLSAYAASTGGAVVEASALNLRAAPNTGAQVYTSVPKGSAVVVGGISEDYWFKVVYQGTVGYMSGDYLSYSQNIDGDFGYGVIYGTSVRMRSAPSLDSAILGTYSNHEKMDIIGVYDNWYKVSYNGVTGYVYSEYMALNGGISQAHLNGSGSYTSAGQNIVNTAMKYLDVPYVWAGTSPSGFDCSGLVYYVYKENGYSINRTAASIYQNGVYVDRSQLQAGDAICFTTGSSGGNIGHVGIYIGNDQFIHASSGSGRVVISSLSSAYYSSHYVGARRIV